MINWSSISDAQRAEIVRARRKQLAYKTELCRQFRDTNNCEFGLQCRFAHGTDELRTRPLHQKYKTTLCRNYVTTGVCPYAARCQFIHKSPPKPVPVMLNAFHQSFRTSSSPRNRFLPINPFAQSTSCYTAAGANFGPPRIPSIPISGFSPLPPNPWIPFPSSSSIDNNFNAGTTSRDMPRFRPINGSSSTTLENVETRENSFMDQDRSVKQLIERIKQVRFTQNYPS